MTQDCSATSTRQEVATDGTFFDPFEGDDLGTPETCQRDANGRFIRGDDDDGVWWGTPRAFYVVAGDTAKVFVIASGYLRGDNWTGYLYGDPADVVMFLECRSTVKPDIIRHVELEYLDVDDHLYPR